MLTFTDFDVARVREYFGYSWDYTQWVKDALDSAARSYGDRVVQGVQQHLADLDYLSTTIDKAATTTVHDDIEVTEEVKDEFRSTLRREVQRGVADTIAAQHALKQRYINAISRAIGLQVFSGAHLIRS